jgi:hypothetical protein
MAHSATGVGVKTGLSDQQKITASHKELGLDSKGKDQKPMGVGSTSSAPHGTKLDSSR